MAYSKTELFRIFYHNSLLFTPVGSVRDIDNIVKYCLALQAMLDLESYFIGGIQIWTEP